AALHAAGGAERPATKTIHCMSWLSFTDAVGPHLDSATGMREGRDIGPCGCTARRCEGLPLECNGDPPMKLNRYALSVGLAVLVGSGAAHAGATLDAVKKKGFVQCGISDGLPGFSYTDAK